MSDTGDAQGDFIIERIADADDNRGRGDPQTAHDSDKCDLGLEAATAAPLPEKPAPSTQQDHGFPDRVRRKYHVVAEERTKEGAALEARVYADERGEYLAFKATEDRLMTRLASAQIIHDMIAVAEHRNWQAVHLRGTVEFRREAWLEASARGIVVKGYEPTEIDRQGFLPGARRASAQADLGDVRTRTGRNLAIGSRRERKTRA